MTPYMVTNYLITVSHSRHTAHHAENIVIHSVDTDLGSSSSRNSRGRKDKLKDSVIDSGEVA